MDKENLNPIITKSRHHKLLSSSRAVPSIFRRKRPIRSTSVNLRTHPSCNDHIPLRKRKPNQQFLRPTQLQTQSTNLTNPQNASNKQTTDVQTSRTYLQRVRHQRLIHSHKRHYDALMADYERRRKECLKRHCAIGNHIISAKETQTPLDHQLQAQQVISTNEIPTKHQLSPILPVTRVSDSKIFTSSHHPHQHNVPYLERKEQKDAILEEAKQSTNQGIGNPKI